MIRQVSRMVHPGRLSYFLLNELPTMTAEFLQIKLDLLRDLCPS